MYIVRTVWRCVGQGPRGSGEPPAPLGSVSPRRERRHELPHERQRVRDLGSSISMQLSSFEHWEGKEITTD
jgi:hypothetical protein